MPVPKITTLSVTQLADTMRGGDLSPPEVIEAHIKRIQQTHGNLNALVDDRFEAAREEARQAQADIDSGQSLPLSGVPFTAKEYLGVCGLSQTGGFHWKKGRRANEDATVIRRLHEAGAIILGVSNGPEGGMWMETDNRIYGRTNHPLDPGRTPGGSSGGEAALVASGASAFGVGSDIGGSIRIPARDVWHRRAQAHWPPRPKHRFTTRRPKEKPMPV